MWSVEVDFSWSGKKCSTFIRTRICECNYDYVPEHQHIETHKFLCPEAPTGIYSPLVLPAVVSKVLLQLCYSAKFVEEPLFYGRELMNLINTHTIMQRLKSKTYERDRVSIFIFHHHPIHHLLPWKLAFRRFHLMMNIQWFQMKTRGQ